MQTTASGTPLWLAITEFLYQQAKTQNQIDYGNVWMDSSPEAEAAYWEWHHSWLVNRGYLAPVRSCVVTGFMKHCSENACHGLLPTFRSYQRLYLMVGRPGS